MQATEQEEQLARLLCTDGGADPDAPLTKGFPPTEDDWEVYHQAVEESKPPAEQLAILGNRWKPNIEPPQGRTEHFDIGWHAYVPLARKILELLASPAQ